MDVEWVDVEWVIRIALIVTVLLILPLFVLTAIFVRSLYLVGQKMQRIGALTKKIEEDTTKLVVGLATWRHPGWLRK